MAKGDKLTFGFYVVVGQFFEERGGYIGPKGKPAIRINRTKPDVGPEEVAVWISMSLPYSLFLKPTITANLSIAEGDTDSVVITPEISNNIADLIRESFGINLKVSVGP